MKKILKLSEYFFVFLSISFVGLLLSATTPLADTIYDSDGFEEPLFIKGSLDGQDGWSAISNGGGDVPTVVTAPQPVMGQQAIRLNVGDTYFDRSLMQIDIPDLLASDYNQVTVSFDIYRTTTIHNLWWYWGLGGGIPDGGIQWDVDEATHPFGWEPGAGSVPTITDNYANLTLMWDFQTSKAYSWYDGVLVDDGFPITGITELKKFTIELSHDSPTGTGSDVAYIDNFVITANPILPPINDLVTFDPDPSSYSFTPDINGIILFKDDFNDGNNFGWTTTIGEWDATSGYNEATGLYNGRWAYTYAGKASWDNYTLDVDITFGTGNTEFIVAVRVDPSSSPDLVGGRQYYLSVDGDNNVIRLRYTKEPSGFFDLQTIPYNLLDKETYHIRISIIGNNLIASIDGNPIFDYTFSGETPIYSNGAIGIGYQSDDGPDGAYFDNVLVEAPGCPSSFAGKFTFDATLTNISEKELSNLYIEVDELTNNNLLLTDNGLIGEGESFEVPNSDDYVDGILSPEEFIDVPFTVCLQQKTPFRLFVNVLGEIGPLFNPKNEHYYQLVEVSSGLNWYEAKDAAAASEYKGLQGHLATFTSLDEETLVVSNFPQIVPNYVWLGATDEAVEGDWKWITGEPWSYTNWDPGEPNGGTSENCLDYSDGVDKWNDESCSRQINFYLLEYSADTLK